jgi:hypothetical protein
LHLSRHAARSMTPPVGCAPDVQRGHRKAVRLHIGGAAGFRGRSTKPARQSRHIARGRHREDISLDARVQEDFRERQVTSPHGLAYPVPVRFRATAHQVPHRLDVAFPKRLGQPSRAAYGLPVWIPGAVPLPPADVGARPASAREPVRTLRRAIERRHRQRLPTGGASLPGNHVPATVGRPFDSGNRARLRIAAGTLASIAVPQVNLVLAIRHRT